MTDPLNVLVCAATGNQGGALARVLLEHGHNVTALTRDPSKPAARALEDAGAALVRGELTDRSDCEHALRGCDAAFLVATPYEQGPDAEVRQGTTFAEAAASTGVGHVVYSSVAGCRDGTGLPHFESKLAIERRIEELGISHTFVAPVYFMENLFMPDSLAALWEGALAMPMSADASLQQVPVADIANFVALVLEDRDRFGGARIEIASDELTGSDAARVLSAVLGRRIEFVAVSREQLRHHSDALASMFEWFEDVGFSVDIKSLRRDFPQVGWHDYSAWAHEQDPAAFA